MRARAHARTRTHACSHSSPHAQGLVRPPARTHTHARALARTLALLPVCYPAGSVNGWRRPSVPPPHTPRPFFLVVAKCLPLSLTTAICASILPRSPHCSHILTVTPQRRARLPVHRGDPAAFQGEKAMALPPLTWPLNACGGRRPRPWRALLPTRCATAWCSRSAPSDERCARLARGRPALCILSPNEAASPNSRTLAAFVRAGRDEAERDAKSTSGDSSTVLTRAWKRTNASRHTRRQSQTISLVPCEVPLRIVCRPRPHARTVSRLASLTSATQCHRAAAACAPTERAAGSRLEPACDAVEVVRVAALAPGDGAVLRVVRRRFARDACAVARRRRTQQARARRAYKGP